MNNFLLWLTAIVIVVLGTLFAVPMFVDWNSYRGTFEREMSKVIGREIRIGGDVGVRLLPSPYLSMEKVRIADSTGRFDTPILKMDRFTVWLSITPMIQGIVEAREIELLRPELRLSLDSDGRGNWIGLGNADADVPFLPNAVALTDAKVVDGTVQLVLDGDRGTFSLGSISGDIAADSLNGPFRFKGRAAFEGIQRDIRLTTDALTAEGALPLRINVAVANNGHTYAFDGSVKGLDANPFADGVLEARLPVARNTADGAAAASPAATFELKSQVAANSDGLKLTEISLTHEHNRRLQKFEAKANIAFGSRLQIEAEIGGRNLDLDQMVSSKSSSAADDANAAGNAVLATVSSAIIEVSGWLPPTGETRVIGRFEQVVLAGEQLVGVDIDLRRQDGKLVLQSLTAGLPGASSLDLSGAIGDAGGVAGFAGDARITGRNLPRLSKWIYPELVFTSPNERAFLLDTSIDYTLDRLKLDVKRAEIAGTSISGGLVLDTGPAKSLDLRIEGNQFDLRDVNELVIPGGGILESIAIAVSGATSEGADSAAPTLPSKISDFGLLSAHIDARVGQLQHRGGTLRDIAIDLTLADDRLTIGRFAAETEDGLSFVTSGALDKISSGAAGQLGFELDAKGPAAMAELEGLIGPAAMLPRGFSERADLAPLRMAGIARFGERGAGSIDLSLDGHLGGSPAQLGLRVDGRQQSLAQRHVELAARIENENLIRLLGQITGTKFAAADAVDPTAEAPTPGVAAMDLRLSGVPDELMSCAFVLEGGGITADYNGRLRAASDGVELEGGLKLSLGSIETAMTLAGLPNSGNLPELAFSVEGQLARSGNSYRLTEAKARVGDSELSGTFSFGRNDGQSLIAVVADANSASLPAVFAALFSKPGSALSEVIDADGASASPWSTTPLTFTSVGNLNGRLDLTFEQLGLVDGLSLEKARIAANLSGNKIDFETIEGTFLGGSLAARGSVTPGDAGLVLAMSGEARDVQLQALTEEEGIPARARGQLSATFSVMSRGLNAANLIDSMTGDGELRISSGSIDRFDPLMVDAAGAVLFADGAKISAERVTSILEEKRVSGSFTFPPLSTSMKIDGGLLRLAPMTASTEAADLTIETKLNLSGLTIDSRWRLIPKSGFSGAAPLPAAVISYSGPLQDVARLTPDLDIADLERELAARAVLRNLLDGSNAAPTEAIIEEQKDIGSAPLPAESGSTDQLPLDGLAPADGGAGPQGSLDDGTPATASDVGAADAINTEAAAKSAEDAEITDTTGSLPDPVVQAKPDAAKKTVKDRVVRKKPKAEAKAKSGKLPFEISPQRLGGPGSEKKTKRPKKPKTVKNPLVEVFKNQR